MPQHKQAKKRVRQNQKHRERNRRQRAKIKRLYKKVLQTEDKSQAREKFKETAAYLDKMALKGRIHPNNAARKKSQMAKHINNL
jgi:small subunit ribosomal protein S20